MKKLSTFLIFIGICLCLTPIAGHFVVKYKQNQLNEEYLKSLEEYNNNINQALQSTVESAETENPTEEAPEPKKPPKPRVIENVIGRISIPSINSNQLLIEGCTYKELNFGAGHVPKTAFPGEIGNCSIAGHRNYTFSTYFNRLDEVKNDDLIEIEYQNNKFTYKVYKKFVVTPDDVSVLASPNNESIVTLITCHPKGSTTHRLIVKATLI